MEQVNTWLLDIWLLDDHYRLLIQREASVNFDLLLWQCKAEVYVFVIVRRMALGLQESETLNA